MDKKAPETPSMSERVAQPRTGVARFRKRFSPQLIVGSIFLVILLIGGGAALTLTQMNQDVRQQASTDADYDSCADGSQHDQRTCFDAKSIGKCNDGNIEYVRTCNGENVCSLGRCVFPEDADDGNNGNQPGRCVTADTVNLPDHQRQYGLLCNCATYDYCDAQGDNVVMKPGYEVGSGTNYTFTQNCFVNATGFQCVDREPDLTIVDGNEGDACNIGQRTQCGVGCPSGQQRLCDGQALGACTVTDACAPAVQNGGSCAGLQWFSGGEPSKGSFVGCSNSQNCFCPTVPGTQTGYVYPADTPYNVTCYDDVQNDSCGAPGIGDPPATPPVETPPPTDTPPPPTPPVTTLYCNSQCSTNRECKDALGDEFFCNKDRGRCRLIEAPNDNNCGVTYRCNSLCRTDAQCQRDLGEEYYCNPARNRCRLKSAPGDNNCGVTYECNTPCDTTTQCQRDLGDAYICEPNSNRCRLNNYPNSDSCTPPVTPSVTPPVGPQCLSISLSNPAPEIGDEITLTCGTVPGISLYAFQIMEPDTTTTALQASATAPNVSLPFTIRNSGKHYAQCAICTAPGQCQEFEPIQTNFTR